MIKKRLLAEHGIRYRRQYLGERPEIKIRLAVRDIFPNRRLVRLGDKMLPKTTYILDLLSEERVVIEHERTRKTVGKGEQTSREINQEYFSHICMSSLSLLRRFAPRNDVYCYLFLTPCSSKTKTNNRHCDPEGRFQLSFKLFERSWIKEAQRADEATLLRNINCCERQSKLIRYTLTAIAQSVRIQTAR